jgi:VanZ family protein
MRATASSLPLRVVDAALRAWRSLPAVVRWAGVAAVVAFLWWSSDRTPKPQPYDPVMALLGNAAHFVAYFGLGLAAWLAAPRAMAPRRIDAGAWWFAVAHGAFDEWHQSWVPGRTSSLVDLATDAFGGAFAVWLVRRRLGGGEASLPAGFALLAGGGAASALATFGPW